MFDNFFFKFYYIKARLSLYKKQSNFTWLIKPLFYKPNF
jgi:hypothetical protein